MESKKFWAILAVSCISMLVATFLIVAYFMQKNCKIEDLPASRQQVVAAVERQVAAAPVHRDFRLEKNTVLLFAGTVMFFLLAMLAMYFFAVFFILKGRPPQSDFLVKNVNTLVIFLGVFLAVYTYAQPGMRFLSALAAAVAAWGFSRK